jgi:AsmA-like C-terminal region
MHRLWIAASALILAALMAILLGLRSESFVLAAAQWAVSSFTDLRLHWLNPRVDVYRGTLSADELHLIPKGTDGPALVSVVDLAVNARLGDLIAANLLHSSVHAKQLLIYVSEHDAAGEPAPMQWLQYLGWLPEELRIAQAHLITAEARTRILPLKQLRGDRLGRKLYQATADADYEGEPLEVVLDLFALTRDGGIRGANLKLALSARQTGSEVSLEGVVEGTTGGFRYDFSLDANYTDIAQFLKGFKAGGNLAGALQVQGRMIGDSRGFVLSDARFVLDNTPAYGFEAGGQLEYDMSGDSRIELVAAGELASLDYLVNWIDLDIGDLGTAHSSIKLSGSLDHPVLDQFRVHTRNAEGLTLSIAGRLDPYGAAAGTLSEKNAINIDIQGPSLASLHHWLQPPAFEPGPWRASGRVTGDRHEMALSNLVLETGTQSTLGVRATGRIGSVKKLMSTDTQAGSSEQYAIADVDLMVEAQAPDSAALAELIDREIPPQHQVTARFRLRGNKQQLALSDGSLAITGPGLQADIAPITAILTPAMDYPLTAVTADIVATLNDTSALSQYSGRPVLSLGPLRVSAKLVQKDTTLQLHNIVGSIEKEKVDIKAQGRVDDILNLSDVSLSGGIADLAGLPTANLGARFSVADPLLLQALVGMPMRPVSGKLIIKTLQGQIDTILTARIGDTQLKGVGSVAHNYQQIQSINIELDIPHFHLGDLGLPLLQTQPPAQQHTQDAASARVPDSTEADERLQKIITGLPPYPVDITISVDGISGDNTNIDSLDIHLSGSDKRYTLQRFSVVYDQALADFRGVIDLNPEPPALSVAGRAVAVPVNSLARDLGVDTNVSGALTLLGGLTTMGSTHQQLLQNLNGSLAMALEAAVIEGAAYDLLATDLLAWVYSGARKEKSTYLDCTMAKFQLTDGVATTDSLYIESSKMVTTGEAEFDLVRQQMDLTIAPLSKSRKLQVPSKVRFKGDMSKPKVVISPMAEAADASASALLLIPKLTMKLFGKDSVADYEHRPCQAQGVNQALPVAN